MGVACQILTAIVSQTAIAIVQLTTDLARVGAEIEERAQQ